MCRKPGSSKSESHHFFLIVRTTISTQKAKWASTICPLGTTNIHKHYVASETVFGLISAVRTKHQDHHVDEANHQTVGVHPTQAERTHTEHQGGNYPNKKKSTLV